MELIKAIEEALVRLNNSPPNEAATCEWVILPLLHATGYDREDVLAKDMDSGGGFPDYTLLPRDEDHKFYLEAKAAQKSLEGAHANQALNYANSNGKRWVILTNGWEWRLYDNSVMGRADAKLAVQVQLKNRQDAERFLRAIGKSSVCSDALPEFVAIEAERRKELAEQEGRREAAARRQEILVGTFTRELSQPGSELVLTLLEQLKNRPGLAEVTAEEICGCLQGTPDANTAPLGQSPPVTSAPGATEQVLVVPAYDAWREYQRCSAYICQDKRTFQPTSHMAFYSDGAIETLVPRILGSIESVLMTRDGIGRDENLSAGERTKLLQLVSNLESGHDSGHLGKRQKVLFLSGPTSSETIRLPHRIVNDKKDKKGKPWAFAVSQRYVSMTKLMMFPAKTSALEED